MESHDFHSDVLNCGFLFLNNYRYEFIPVDQADRDSIKGPGGNGGTSLCDLNGDVQTNRVWLSGCFIMSDSVSN